MVAGARGRHLGEAQAQPGGFRPDARLAEAGDVVRPTQIDADQRGRTALGGVNDVPREMRIGEERIEGTRVNDVETY